MAGAGYKLFNTGDVLTAAQVNTYLQEQTVMVFASSTARTTALSGVLAEGMVSYLQDTNAVEVYNGSAWTAVGGGGLTSPLTTKGDVWGYSTTNARIPVGANGTVLTADSAESLGVKWATPAGGGKVLQVVQVETSTSTSVTSATFTDSGLSGSITPSSASSKILVMTMQPIAISRASNPVSARFRLLRGATTIWDGNGSGGGGFRVFAQAVTNDGLDLNALQNINYLDSPNTTSSVTYKTQMRVQTASDAETVTAQAAGRPSTIILMEIGA